MSIGVILLIRKHRNRSQIYKKQLCEFAKAQGYHIKETIYVKERSPLIYSSGRSLVLDQLIETKATTLLVYSFQHLSQRREELLAFIEALNQADIQCYAVLEKMYLQEIKMFLSSPH